MIKENFSTLFKIKIKVILYMLIPAVLFLMFHQLIIWFFNMSMDIQGADLGERIITSFQGSVYSLFFAFFVLWMFILFQVLKPLFKYLKTQDQQYYSKARKATIKVPLINIALVGAMWIIGIIVYNWPRGWVSETGIPWYFMMYMKTFSGLLAGVYSTILVDFMLMKFKDQLNITDILTGENDMFSRYRDVILLILFINYILSHIAYIAYYYSRKPMDLSTPINLSVILISVIILWNAIGLGLSFLSRKEKIYQTRFLNNKLKEFSEGNADLTRRLVIINFDDIGDIAKNFNQLMQKLNQDFQKIRNLTGGFSDNAEQIANASHDLAASSEEQAASSEEISTTMDTFSEQIEKIKGDTEQQFDMISTNFEISNKLSEALNHIIFRSSDLKDKTTHTLESAQKGMDEIKTSMDNTKGMSDDIHMIVETIKQAGEKTEQIDSILNQIEDIVEQTSMLSMNAAIEAAHAGDAGKGFAIVAQEIRELANNSAKSVQNISTIISEIKNGVEQAVVKAEKGEKHVLSTRQMATSSENNLFRIIDGIKNTSDMIFAITDTTQKQTSLIEELVSNSKNIKHFSEEIMNFLREEAMGAQQIDQTILSMTQNQESFVESTVELSDLSEKLHLMARQLAEVINQFNTEE